MPFGISAYGGFPVSSSITVQPRDHISEAGDAPLSSMTSGATITNPISFSGKRGIEDPPTPVGRASDIALDVLHRMKVERNTKVREFHIAVLGREDISCLEIAVDDLWILNDH